MSTEFSGGVADSDIDKEEATLGRPILGTLRSFIRKYGSQFDDGILGINKVNGGRISTRAKRLWNEGLPTNFVPFCFFNNLFYCLDMNSPTSEGEFRVVAIHMLSLDGNAQYVSESFGQFFVEFFDLRNEMENYLRKHRQAKRK